jgi:class 3 adenylate cyclase
MADVTLTGPGVTLGTVAYMSPEQARGDRVDHRTDLWSLGVVLYEMLTGERPFRGGNELPLLRAILQEDPEPIAKLRPDIPQPVPGIVERLLRKDPAARHETAADLIADLLGALPPGSLHVPVNETERVAAVRSYGVIGTPPENSYDELIELAARLCRMPSAYIKFFDDTRVWFKSKVGMPPDLTEMPREATLCNWTLCQSDLVVIPDCSADERFRHHATVNQWPKVRFYCSMPLIDAEGYALGTFCVFDYVPRELAFEDQELVRTLARQVVTLLRLRRLSTRHDTSVAQLGRVTHELEQERSRSESLLNDILPRPVAEELRATGQVQPRYYPLVTVLFTDFHGFGRFARSMEPARLVTTLHQYFDLFDGIVERHGLEKIKTIGDSYMCAGGAPVAGRSHIADGCLAALAFQAGLARLNLERAGQGLDPWYLRIGIHTGPAMTGMVGRRKFTYDIWGDAVDGGLGMKTAGAPGRINVSESVYHRVRHLFDIEPRGHIETRDGDHRAMYYLNRIKPELSEDAEGFLANGRFATERGRAG